MFTYVKQAMEGTQSVQKQNQSIYVSTDKNVIVSQHSQQKRTRPLLDDIPSPPPAE